MCIIEQWYIIHPDGHYELREHFHRCQHSGLPDHRHQPEIRTLQNQYLSLPLNQTVAEVVQLPQQYEDIAPNVDLSGSGNGRRKSKMDGLRFEFDWHIPFTSRKRRLPKVTVIRPVTPPPLRPEVMYFQPQPHAWPPHSDMRPRVPVGPPPQVIPITPRPEEPRRSASQRNHRRRPEEPAPLTVATREHARRPPPRSPSPPHRQHSIFPTRVHTRRSSNRSPSPPGRRRSLIPVRLRHLRIVTRSPSPPRRNPSDRRLRQIDEHLHQLEADLVIAQREARRERIGNLQREIDNYRIRQEYESGTQERRNEQDESRADFDRERRDRAGLDRQRPVIVHQPRDGNFDDRGTRVLEQAVRDRHARQEGHGTVAAGQAGVRGSIEGRDRNIGEEIVWDDDRARTGRRFI